MIAMITDTHFGVSNFDKTIFHYQLDFFKEQFFPFLLEHNVKDVLHLGDLCHHRQVMDIYIQQNLDREFFGFFEKNDIKLWLLVGNHDTYYKADNDISYVYTLEKYKSVVIIDKPFQHIFENKNFGFIPWGYESELNKGILHPDNISVLCGHFEMGDILENPVRSTLKVSDFADYEEVLSGHYHSKIKNSTVQYCGSPYPMDRNDYGMQKGFWYYDITGKHFVENTISPKFLKVEYNDDGKNLSILVDDGITKTEFSNAVLATEFIGENFTDIYVKKYINEVMLDKFLGDIKNTKRYQNYEVVAALEEESQQTEHEKGIKDSCIEYINALTFEIEINQDFLIELFTELYDEAEEML